MTWRVGDLAVCVDVSPDPFGVPMPLSLGQVSRVSQISQTGGLGFAETESCPCLTWKQSRFRKVKPSDAWTKADTYLRDIESVEA